MARRTQPSEFVECVPLKSSNEINSRVRRAVSALLEAEMPDYRRWYTPGGTYFFTVVTHRRKAIFTTEEAVSRLRTAFSKCLRERPMTINAIVILPDHFHMLITLPDGDDDYSSRIGMIKAKFSAFCSNKSVMSPVRDRRHESENWQRRFWEHEVESEDEAFALADYVHYNPVKHGHAKCPHDWSWSSFHSWVNKNWVEPDWGCCCANSLRVRDFGSLARIVGE
jgi:putative transposase